MKRESIIPAIIGLTMIMSGVVIITVFLKMSAIEFENYHFARITRAVDFMLSNS
jgi:hypothetical protein